jgi:hypothetical protein
VKIQFFRVDLEVPPSTNRNTSFARSCQAEKANGKNYCL